MNIYTIGYEGLSMETFLSLLAKHGVDTVVDVREAPISRKPGFSKTALANALNLSGLEYVHMASLGCPRQVRDQYRLNGDWRQYTDGFLRYLETQHNAIVDLSSLIATSECALLCYEADYNFCHRSMVANAVRDHSGAEVLHIGTQPLKKSKAAVHPEALA